MTLRLYNTLTRRIEDFRPLEEGRVRIYTCGPTVYDTAHVGNFRTFLFEDILRRYLKWKGYQVVQVRNLTDVDDRTIHAAVAQGVTLRELTLPFIDAFFRDHDRLGLERAEHYPRATDYVPQMVELVQRLVERGLAYEADGSVYFDISEFPGYGDLAQLDRASLREGRETGDAAYDKGDARDFVLWKGGERPEEGDVAIWDSPWGAGRPGWHLECSVMAIEHLGQPFDIHSGGVDLVFPHHTNEIAQAEGATGEPFARFWLHAKHALLDGRKMSKSENHYYTVNDLVDQGYQPSAIRRLLISGHYRAELNFTLAGLDDSSRSVARLIEFRRRLRASRSDDPGLEATRLPELADQALRDFETALDDDLNVAEAWGALFSFVREANTTLDRAGERVQAADADAALAAVDSIDQVFGVLALAEREAGVVSEELRSWVEAKLAERADARAAKDYVRADAIRGELAERGIEVEDSPAGSRWRLVRQA
ncbi:MAG: cysteine--tRNA ligase [Gemmatimonadetes bacterium]|nr:cysteine--tRNA ligase [Gemmatimonadota bacterium]NIO30837.1 cysteine--tRNA ligase [Gemmatimonadota bacterium]